MLQTDQNQLPCTSYLEPYLEFSVNDRKYYFVIHNIDIDSVANTAFPELPLADLIPLLKCNFIDDLSMSLITITLYAVSNIYYILWP
jgi:hypothetical protein